MNFIKTGLFLALIFIINQSVAAQPTMIQVHDEPFHKVVYEGENYRIIHLEMEVGDTSQLHRHDTPILYLTANGAAMWLDVLGATPRLAELPDGWVGSDFYSDTASMVHRIAPDSGSLNLIAFQKKAAGRNIALEAAPAVDRYVENGFTVMELDSAALGITSIPLVVKSGICPINRSRILEPGSLLDAALYQTHRATIDSCQLTFWKVSF